MFVTFEQYHKACAPLEGRVPTMYCDCLGLITTAVGNLINTLPQALALPWLLADGSKADQADVAADWHKLHDNAQYYAKRSWKVYAPSMKCHLSEEAIDAFVKRTLDTNEGYFRKHWPAWDTFPADAQLAIMSHAWAVGPAFWTKFPNLARCIAAQDWEGCVASCKIREEGNPGVVPRNALNRFCYHNAALSRADDLDPSVLFWPAVVPSVNDHAANAAAIEAVHALADWHKSPLSRFVDDEYNKIREAGPHGARDAIEFEREP